MKTIITALLLAGMLIFAVPGTGHETGNGVANQTSSMILATDGQDGKGFVGAGMSNGIAYATGVDVGNG